MPLPINFPISVDCDTPYNGGSPIISYTVEAVSTTETITEVDTVKPIIINVANGIPYTIRMRATNAVGDSNVSDPVIFIRPAPPQAVSNTWMTITGNSSPLTVTITFDLPTSDGGSPITGYSVDDGGGNFYDVSNILPVTVQIPAPAVTTDYTFSVSAVNIKGAGPSTPTNTVTVTI